MSNEEKVTDQSKVKLWINRIGAVGFLFFLIKGLIWIGIGIAAYYAAKK